jgi:formyl-CoA transferase
MAALLARQQTGVGQRVDTSLLQATMAFLGENSANFFEEGHVPTRETRCRRALVFAFTAGDTLPFVVHLSSPDKFWRNLLLSLDRPDLADDPRFVDRPNRIKNYEALQRELQTTFEGKPRAEWLRRLEAADVPSGPLNSIDEVFADPQVQALEMKVTLPHALRGSVNLVGNPVRFSKTPVQMVHASPLLGADNDKLDQWI